MSLVEVKETDAVKNLYFFKLTTFSGAFSTLLITQLIAIVFSFSGIVSSGGGGDGIWIETRLITADMEMAFTILWALITAILVTTKSYRYGDYSFVTNRLSSHLSSILFMVTGSAIGGICAVLSGFLIKDILYFKSPAQFLIVGHLDFPLFLMGMIAAILYVLLFSSLGYLFGTLVQLHKVFAFIIPVLVFGMLFIGSRIQWAQSIFIFYYDESSFLLFVIKALVSAGCLFAASIVISNRLEVRK